MVWGAVPLSVISNEADRLEPNITILSNSPLLDKSFTIKNIIQNQTFKFHLALDSKMFMVFISKHIEIYVMTKLSICISVAVC